MKTTVIENRYYRWFIAIAGVVLLLSFIPRFYDILKFLPDYSIDENEIVEYAVGYYGGDLDQRFYSYGPLLSYFMAVVYWVMSLFSPLSLDEFAQGAFFHNVPFYYAARFVNSLTSIATAFVIFKIIRKVWSKEMAYISLPLLAFPFAELLTGFKVRIDVFLGLFYALSLYFMTLNFDNPKTKWFVISALFAGMGFACKPLPSLLILPSLIMAFGFLHFNDNVKTTKKQQKSVDLKTDNFWIKTLKSIPLVLKDRRFYFFLAMLVFSAYLFFPHAFKNWGAENGFKEQQFGRIAYEGGKSGTAGWRLDTYLKSLGLGYVIVCVAGLFFGLIKAFRTNDYKKIVVIVLPIMVLLAFAKEPARVYWYAPIAYLLIFGFVSLLSAIFERIKGEKLRFVVSALFVVVLIFQPAKNLTTKTIKLNKGNNYKELHTTLSSKKWIEENIPAGKNLAMYGYYVKLPRLIDANVNRQAQIGEYFMYYRGGNKYYVNQFVEAHKKYVGEKTNVCYTLTQNLKFKTQEGRDNKFYLRYQKKELEPYMAQLLRMNRVDYLVTNYQQSANFDDKLVRSFLKKDYPFGPAIYIYKIN